MHYNGELVWERMKNLLPTFVYKRILLEKVPVVLIP